VRGVSPFELNFQQGLPYDQSREISSWMPSPVSALGLTGDTLETMRGRISPITNVPMALAAIAANRIRRFWYGSSNQIWRRLVRA